MTDAERRNELADFLRTRRARLSPAEVGLPRTARRKKNLISTSRPFYARSTLLQYTHRSSKD